jgi:predicted esterase
MDSCIFVQEPEHTPEQLVLFFHGIDDQMLAIGLNKDDLISRPTHIFCTHDFIGIAVL